MSFVRNDWVNNSIVYSLVGRLANWREASWLLQWSQVLAVFLLALVLGLAPFVTTSLIGVLLIALGMFWLLLTMSDTERVSSGMIDKLVLVYWCIATVSTAFSPVKNLALDGWIKLTLYLLMFALCARVLRQPKAMEWLITIFLHVSLIVSVYGVRQQIFGVEQLATWNDPNSPLANDTRVYSYLENPNLLAGYLLPAIALSLGAVFIWRAWLPKILAIVIFMVNSACLVYTDSRGGWLAMAGVLAVFGILSYFWFYKKLPAWCRLWIPIVVVGVISLGMLVTFWQVETVRLRILSIFAGREDSSNNFRLQVWASVLKMIRDYPILGIGPGGKAFQAIYPLYMHPNYSSLGAYSIYLETTVETGLIGISCFLALIGVTLSRGIFHYSRLRRLENNRGFWVIGAIAGIVGLLIQGGFDIIWYRPQVNTLWWFLVAIIASLDFQSYPKSSKS